MKNSALNVSICQDYAQESRQEEGRQVDPPNTDDIVKRVAKISDKCSCVGSCHGKTGARIGGEWTMLESNDSQSVAFKVDDSHLIVNQDNFQQITANTRKPRRSRALALADSLFAHTEQLKSIDEWHKLSPLQKQIVYEHFNDPFSSKKAISQKLNCKESTVWALFHSKAFEAIVSVLAGIQKVELRIQAMQTLGECLRSKDQAVRLSAASKILADSGDLRAETKTVKQDNKIMVIWGTDKKLPSPVQEIINGDS